MACRPSALQDRALRRLGWIDSDLRRGPRYVVFLALSALRTRSLRCRHGHPWSRLGDRARVGSASAGAFAAVDQSVAVDSRAFGAQSQASLVDASTHFAMG